MYLCALFVAGLLLWLVFKQVDVKELISRLGEVKYGYVIIAMGLAIFSYWVRGYRWRLMLEPLGYPISSFRTFLAVNIGYLANLFLPRMGEITRCGVLKRTDNVNLTVSFGSVVAERIIDLITLFVITLLSLLLEYELLSNYLKDIFSSQVGGISSKLPAIYLILGVGVVLLITTYFFLRAYKEKLKKVPLFLKIRGFVKEMAEGLTGITKIKKQGQFWASTVLMWLIYYIMTYIVVFSIPETSNLTMTAGLTILVTGSFGMATPVQGGIGAFHALVSGVLVLYGIALEDGILYATILHSSQVIGVIVFGGISLLITMFLKKKNFELSNDSEKSK
jgi:uncharacterized protein (TIRG00374 family)